MKRMSSCLLWVGLCILPTLPARAGNDDEILLGNDAALVAGAVVASVNDGSALWYNPAGLGHADRDSVDVAASAFALRRYDYPSLLRVEDGEGGDASFTEFVTIPSALTYLRRFGKGVVGGLGLFSSHFNDATLRTTASQTGPGGTLTYSYGSSIEVARYHLIAGVGMRLPRGFALGVSLSGDYQAESDVSNVAIIGKRRGTTISALSGYGMDQTTTLGLHLRAGLTYDVASWLRLGVSVESPGMYFYRGGHSTELSINADEEPSLQARTEDSDKDGLTGGLYAPVRFRFGTAFSVGGGIITVEGDVASRIRDAEVDVDRVFTWNVRAGARFPVSERYRIGAGFFTDRSPERSDEAGRIQFYGGTMGVQYERSHLLASNDAQGESRRGLTFSSTAAIRYAYGRGQVYALDIDSDGGISDGTGSIRIQELTLHLGSGLYF